MAQNIVVPNKDNKVIMIFSGVDLTKSTNIIVNFGSETYSTTVNPSVVIIDSATQLSLNLSGTTETGRVYATVTYFDAGTVNGIDITSQEVGNLDQIIVAIGTQLIIEDGSIVTNANSFATDEEFKTYANLRGMQLPATQPERESLLVLAMDYIFSIENDLQGYRTSDIQELPFPRSNVVLNYRYVADNAIPKTLKNAQLELALQANVSELLINEQSSNIISEKLDTLQVDYNNAGKWSTVRTGRANAYLEPLFKQGNSNLMGRV